MKIWQQSGGDGDRNYIGVCLQWGVILNGPSKHGPWDAAAREKYRANGVTSKKCTDLERFAFGMKDGDVVILRLGTNKVFGVGKIVGDYEFHEAFLDIDGWDIAHVRRVKWLWTSKDKPKSFATFTLKQGDTTQLLTDGNRSAELRNWIDSILNKISAHKGVLPLLPPSKVQSISLRQACQRLYDCGLGASSVSAAHDKMADLANLATWYRLYMPAQGVSESETVAQLVLPLLSVLGWSPQTLAMEWANGGRRIDLAAFRPFRGSIRNADDINLIVEAKRLDRSCLRGADQGRSYAKPLKNCLRLVVSDGVRYAVFVRRSGNHEFDASPTAYLNLSDPKDRYPILECDGADEALLLLSAAWHPQLIKLTPSH